jgi:hypothetical protein
MSMKCLLCRWPHLHETHARTIFWWFSHGDTTIAHCVEEITLYNSRTQSFSSVPIASVVEEMPLPNTKTSTHDTRYTHYSISSRRATPWHMPCDLVWRKCFYFHSYDTISPPPPLLMVYLLILKWVDGTWVWRTMESSHCMNHELKAKKSDERTLKKTCYMCTEMLSKTARFTLNKTYVQTSKNNFGFIVNCTSNPRPRLN